MNDHESQHKKSSGITGELINHFRNIGLHELDIVEPFLRLTLLSQYKRTSCSCSKCKHGCTVMPAYLLPQDLEGYLNDGDKIKHGESCGMWVKYNYPYLLASEGTLTQMIDKRSGSVTKAKIPMLVPESSDDGSCVHYTDGKCGVHKHSPTGCRMFNACAEGRDADKQEEVAREYQIQLMESWINYGKGYPHCTNEERFTVIYGHTCGIKEREERTKQN
jgi:Fe-S-cluster containining protein